jgi:hypothetical protein
LGQWGGFALESGLTGIHPTIVKIMRCDEKNRLLGEYRISVASYRYAVSEFTRRRDTTNPSEGEDLRRLVADARKMSGLAWDDLDGHIADHGC